MPQAAPSQSTASSHPEFPNGTEIVNVSPRSRYFGHRGVVYGSGPSRRNTDTSSVIYVRWPDGERFKYFPNSLAVAPKKETEYCVSTNKRSGRKVSVHQIPASPRRVPNIIERFAASRNASTTTET